MRRPHARAFFVLGFSAWFGLAFVCATTTTTTTTTRVNRSKHNGDDGRGGGAGERGDLSGARLQREEGEDPNKMKKKKEVDR